MTHEQRIEIAVAALLRRNETHIEVLIARRHAAAVRGDLWEFPGGKCNDGEQPAHAAARELFEETGITVNATTALVLGRVEQNDPHMASERFLALTLVAFISDGSSAPRAIASAECVWERVDHLTRYAWPAGNERLNAILLRAIADGICE
jgi:mutator protein MutT